MSVYISARLRRIVYQRAQGRCEYCCIPETAVFAMHEIDHIIPQKHGGATNSENLALACTFCNKHKGTDFASFEPETGLIVPLYHPRRDRWMRHFRMHEDGHMLPLTPTGRATIRILQFNHPDRLKERQLLIAAGIFQPHQ